MISLIVLFSVLILFNLIILFFFNYIKNLINIYDYPDKKKKLHSKPIPLFGGWIFLFNLIFFLILKIADISSSEMYIIILCSLIFLIIGIVDDKYNLQAYSKFLSLLIILCFFFYFFDNLIINNLKIYNYNIHFNNYIAFFFSILCVLLFVNAFNLFDGINLQSSLYSAYIFLFIFYKGLYTELTLILLIPLSLIVYLNGKNKIFMGNGGTLFLGCLISLLIIANYNKKNFVNADEIFLLMLVPGIDMFRLFLQRIFYKKNPFIGDREHLHHYLLEVYGYRWAIILILLITILPSLLSFFIDSIVLTIFFITLYLLIFIFIKKKIIKKIT
jgi:UDP-GlcNAc:undecaprenyl-phosphate GlcNAc-1-phosphate transferase